MGFYSPATIIDDAKRHGVRMLPVDVNHSDWNCTLERQGRAREKGATGGKKEVISISGENGDYPLFSIRIGLRYVKGVREEYGRRIEEARRSAPFSSLTDFASRTMLGQGVLNRLAEAGALTSLRRERRQALWETQGIEWVCEHPLSLDTRETLVDFSPLGAFETVGWDYRTTGHSIRGHPLTYLREDLTAAGLPDAMTVRQMKHGEKVHYAGVVICRQRPGTAKGVIFMTLEDETGFVNIVLWQNVYEKFRIPAKTLSFMGVTGTLQAESNVVHIVAESIWQPRLEKAPGRRKSRDFQ